MLPPPWRLDLHFGDIGACCFLHQKPNRAGSRKFMNPDSQIDQGKTHAHFSAECFNAAWELIDQRKRSEEDSLKMLDSAHASLWHWKQRQDCTSKNLAVGYWQLSRIYSILHRADIARQYGHKSLSLTEQSDPFNRAFAHEAIARAEMAAGNREAMDQHLLQARKFLEKVPRADDAAWLK